MSDHKIPAPSPRPLRRGFNDSDEPGRQPEPLAAPAPRKSAWKWVLLLWMTASVIFWVEVWPRLWEGPRGGLTLVEVGEGEPRGEGITQPAIYFVPIDGFPEEILHTLRDHFKDRWELDVRILPAMTVETTAELPSTTQLDAYDLAFQLQRAYEAEVDPVAIIGFTTEDLNQAEGGLNWVFGADVGGGYASISTARMDPLTYGDPPNDELMMGRLRKFTTRYIAFTYFGLPRNGNPSSVLSTLLSVDDLDAQTEFPCPSQPFVMAAC